MPEPEAEINVSDQLRLFADEVENLIEFSKAVGTILPAYNRVDGRVQGDTGTEGGGAR